MHFCFLFSKHVCSIKIINPSLPTTLGELNLGEKQTSNLFLIDLNQLIGNINKYRLHI